MSGGKYGLDAELASKRTAAYSKDDEILARKWIEAVVGEEFPVDDFATSLKDGVLLCEYDCCTAFHADLTPA